LSSYFTVIITIRFHFMLVRKLSCGDMNHVFVGKDTNYVFN